MPFCPSDFGDENEGREDFLPRLAREPIHIDEIRFREVRDREAMGPWLTGVQVPAHFDDDRRRCRDGDDESIFESRCDETEPWFCAVHLGF